MSDPMITGKAETGRDAAAVADLGPFYRLSGGLQRYAWGTVDDLAELFGFRATAEPAAEWWMGAHPALPSTLVTPSGEPLEGRGPAERRHDGERRARKDPLAFLERREEPDRRGRLDLLIETDPQRWLGGDEPRFGQLPYLLKVLAIASPLSIQVHPSKAQAEDGYERENRQGIDPAAPNRSYRDTNHKPEIICALSDVEALCGFAPLDQSIALLRAMDDGTLQPVADELESDPSPAGLRRVIRKLLHTDWTVARRWAAAIEAGARRAGAEYLVPIAHHYPDDPGVVVAALLNHVWLRPGDALVLGAGQIHAYLRGVVIELMANSDNVLRGGLTPKHIDVDELIDVLDATPEQLVPAPFEDIDGARRWATGVADFSLVRLQGSEFATAPEGVPGTGRIHALGIHDGPRIVLCTAGSGELRSSGASVPLGKGVVILVAPDVALVVAGSDDLVAFVASSNPALR